MNSTYFEHLQSLEIYTPVQAEFTIIEETGDLLLYILTDYSAQPLLIYHYKGLIGFDKIVEGSTISKGFSLNPIHLRNCERNFIAIVVKGGVTFIESVIKKI